MNVVAVEICLTGSDKRHYGPLLKRFDTLMAPLVMGEKLQLAGLVKAWFLSSCLRWK